MEVSQEAFAHYKAGINLSTAEKYEESIAEFKKAVDIEPNFTAAYIYLGSIFYKLGKPEDADENFLKATGIEQNNADIYYNWGNAAFTFGNYKKAIEKFQKVVDLEPTYQEVYFYWGKALYLLDRYEEAIEQFGKAIQSNPNHAEAYNIWGYTLCVLGQYREAIEQFEKAIEFKQNYEYAYNNWGIAFYGLGEYDNAIKKYQKAIEIKQDYGDAYNNWGLALHQQGKYEEAISKYAKAIEIRSDDTYAYNKIGNALEKLYRYDEASQAYRKAIEFEPTNIAFHVSLANLLWGLSQYSEAIAKYKEIRKLVEVDKANLDKSYLKYGNILYTIFGELDGAEKIYKEGLEKDKRDSIDILINLGNLYHKKSQISDEKKSYYHNLMVEAYREVERLLLRIDLNYITTLNHLGHIYVCLGKYEEAKKYLRDAIYYQRKENENISPYISFGLLYTYQKDYEKAEYYFKEALRIDSDNLMARNNLATVYYQQNKTEKAQAEYKKILSVTPYHIESHIGLGDMFVNQGNETKELVYFNLAIYHFELSLAIVESDNRSKVLMEHEKVTIYYLIGYSYIKLYEVVEDIKFLKKSKIYFEKCFSNKSELAFLNMKVQLIITNTEKRLGELNAKVAIQWGIPIMAYVFFYMIQDFYYHQVNITLEQYAAYSLGSFIVGVVGYYLPHITKIKFKDIEIEKNPVQNMTNILLGIEPEKWSVDSVFPTTPPTSNIEKRIHDMGIGDLVRIRELR